MYIRRGRSFRRRLVAPSLFFFTLLDCFYSPLSLTGRNALSEGTSDDWCVPGRNEATDVDARGEFKLFLRGREWRNGG